MQLLAMKPRMTPSMMTAKTLPLRSFLLLLTLLLAACTAISEPAGDRVDAADSRLAGSQWRLQHIQSMTGEVFVPATGALFTLTFQDAERVMLQADCNRGNGSYNETGSQQQVQEQEQEQEQRSAEIRPTFDCLRAGGTVEELICNDSDLALLDQQLNYLYGLALQRVAEEERGLFRAFQRGWISGRNDCWKAEDVKACVRLENERRISELQISSGSVRVPEAVLYSCPPNLRLDNYFYNNTMLPMLVVNDGREQTVMHRLPAASGARYGIGNLQFWDRGNEALYIEFEDQVQCVTQ